MTMMLGKLHAALLAAGVPDDQARAAAEEVAEFELRLAKITSDLTLLKWMVGTNVALTFIVLGKIFVS